MKKHLDHMVNHIAKLAMNPAWMDEMRRWTKELEQHESGYYKGLGVAVAERIKSLKEQQKNGDCGNDRDIRTNSRKAA
jgi:hypothetical protein